METTGRSLLKATSWRVTATLITSTVVFFMTGELSFAAKVGAIDTIIKFAVYFGHERAWNLVPYGRVKAQPEYHI